MNRIVSLAAVLLMTVSLFAADVKVGIIDYEKVFSSYYKTDLINTSLKTRTDDWQKKLDDYKTQISGMKEQYDKGENAMSDDVKKTERKKIMDKLQEYQDLGQDLTTKLKEEQFKEYEKLKKEIDEVIQKFGKDQKFSMILDRAFIFFGGEDVTDQLIKELNKGQPKK